MDDAIRSTVDTGYVDISLVAMLRVIRKHLVLFSLFVILCTGAGVAYAYLATPFYRSQTLLSPVSESSMAGGTFGQILSGFGFGSMGIRQARNSRAVGLAGFVFPLFHACFYRGQQLITAVVF